MSLKDEFASALRAEGKRFTSQRAIILQVLEKSEGHLEAEEIYRRARELDPRISLSTVYRTLGVLKDMGLVRELHLDEEHHHYELAGREPHYHLICSNCGQVIEFTSDLVEKLLQELRQNYGFQVDAVHIDVIGLCHRCKARGQ